MAKLDTAVFDGLCGRCQRPSLIRWSWMFEAWMCGACVVVTRRRLWGVEGRISRDVHPCQAPHPVGGR